MWDFLQSIYNLYEFIAVCFFIPAVVIMFYLMNECHKLDREVGELKGKIWRMKALKEEA